VRRVCPGGATGAGAALDASTRGLRTALVEAEDFAAGTSSRSTKLIHGGVRYLEKAVWQVRSSRPSARRARSRTTPPQLDYGQLKLVFEALHERLHMLRAAPHLTNPIPTMMPCYKLWEVRGSADAHALRLLTRSTPAGQVPYFWAGLKAYDAVAGTSALAWSHFLGAAASREVFPTLLAERPDGNTLKGSVSGSTCACTLSALTPRQLRRSCITTGR
jgi:glycerol-3-phosphate dehydrogenase